MIILIEAEKSILQNSTVMYYENFQQTGIEINFFNLKKAYT